MGLLVATAVHWFAAMTHDMFEHCMRHGWVWNGGDVATLVVLLAIIGSAAYLIHRLASQSLTVLQISETRRHPALLLFLSQAVRAENLVDESGEESAVWAEFKEQFGPLVDEFAHSLRDGVSPQDAGLIFRQNSWCMPMVAVAHHAAVKGHGEPLQCVVAIGSADSGGTRRNGTWRQAAFFQEMLKRLFAEWGRPESCPKMLIPFERGIDFYNLYSLSKAVTRCYHLLAEHGIANPLVDITGGTKECSIAGAALALEPGRLFQYVSTEDRVVRQYDLSYRPHDSLLHGGH